MAAILYPKRGGGPVLLRFVVVVVVAEGDGIETARSRRQSPVT